MNQNKRIELSYAYIEKKSKIFYQSVSSWCVRKINTSGTREKCKQTTPLHTHAFDCAGSE